MPIVEGGTESLEMRKKVRAHIELDLSRNTDHDATHEKAEYATQNSNPGKGCRQREEPIGRDTFFETIDCELENPRSAEQKEIGENQTHAADNQRFYVPGQIAPDRPECYFALLPTCFFVAVFDRIPLLKSD